MGAAVWDGAGSDGTAVGFDMEPQPVDSRGGSCTLSSQGQCSRRLPDFYRLLGEPEGLLFVNDIYEALGKQGQRIESFGFEQIIDLATDSGCNCYSTRSRVFRLKDTRQSQS